MADRKPHLMTARAGQRATRIGSELTPDQRGMVLIPVVYTGLKHEPIDVIALPEQQAVALAATILEAAVTARHRATERTTEETSRG
jgi:hypothetical protein